jgi:hypothetical protein
MFYDNKIGIDNLNRLIQIGFLDSERIECEICAGFLKIDYLNLKKDSYVIIVVDDNNKFFDIKAYISPAHVIDKEYAHLNIPINSILV